MYGGTMRRFVLLFLGVASCAPSRLIVVPSESKGDVAVWFINDSQHDICDLRMAVAASANNYSWIASAESMFPAGEATGVRVRPGTYQALAKSCDGKWEAANVQVDISGPTVLSLGGTAGIKQVALQSKP